MLKSSKLYKVTDSFCGTTNSKAIKCHETATKFFMSIILFPKRCTRYSRTMTKEFPNMLIFCSVPFSTFFQSDDSKRKEQERNSKMALIMTEMHGEKTKNAWGLSKMM